MGDVVDILEKKEHLAGKFLCLNCKHVWTGIAPVGTPSFECPNPECGLFKGVAATVIGVADAYWQCKCGCLHFFIDRTDGPVCCYCGAPAKWF